MGFFTGLKELMHLIRIITKTQLGALLREDCTFVNKVVLDWVQSTIPRAAQAYFGICKAVIFIVALLNMKNIVHRAYTVDFSVSNKISLRRMLCYSYLNTNFTKNRDRSSIVLWIFFIYSEYEMHYAEFMLSLWDTLRKYAHIHRY